MLQLAILSASAEGGGFNPLDPIHGGGLLWTWVIFLIALPFMWKLVMGPIAAALEERDGHATRAIAAAEKASRDAEAARAEVEVRLSEARAEAARMVGEARGRAETREREIVEEAKVTANALLDNARKAIQAEQDKAVATIRKEVVQLSLNAAGKAIGRKVDSEDDRRFVSELVGASKSMKP